ncbi:MULTISPECIES: DUF1439 domain-containing protein [unclassified Pseudoalteromonas]|uniref:DUF1439 domain-containing protein n=1 Tax=unclassified Pseudoalteromonas TaxID=194690 RepID=UPI0025B51C0D|nr:MULTISPECIES: DUF1439 domain-containing protein [unclassified Pseudoalteromonas]MDN3380202.1 DUF1439 domain-containing protein [Pseudoalteromonas sp. APC 3893]MDN3388467.1 DUF1439 domain-containing protein [Pseudoalteromonas sp. APC 4017]
MKYILLISCLFLSACNTTNGVSVYSFTNSEIESVLNQQLPKLSEQVKLMGLPVQFDVNDLSVNVSPDNRDVVVLGADSSAIINAFAIKYPVRLKLQIEGAPFYDSEKKAVFLRNVKLLDSSIDAGGFKGNLGVLDDEAMKVINGFLAVNPVYTLNMNDPKVALLSKLPLDMKVEQGAIKLVPSI